MLNMMILCKNPCNETKRPGQASCGSTEVE
jgi:hypothetical protein